MSQPPFQPPFQAPQAPPPQQAPAQCVLTFVGPIEYPATKSFRSVCAGMANSGVKKITLLLSSPGGSTVEGFALYHFLRALPVELVTHNIGSIESIANVVFLAGSKRLCCANTRFMIHGFSATFRQQEMLDINQVAQRADSLEGDQSQFVEIFKRHTNMTDEMFDSIQPFKTATIFKTDKAKELGIIHEIADASVPSGTPILNIEF